MPDNGTRVTMDDHTDSVHTHIVNYEPTYQALETASTSYDEDLIELADARDFLMDAVEKAAADDAEHFGLTLAELDTDRVDYAAMIAWEIDHAD